MPRNVEIKARVADPAKLTALAEGMAGGPAETLRQRDVFFNAERGRLKLRTINDASAELIYYERDDAPRPRESAYSLAPIEHPERVEEALGNALGVRGIVAKTRRLFLVGPARIHVDDVADLGAFVEIEVVLRDGQRAAEGHSLLRDLMERLGIAGEDILPEAYIDMLEHTEESKGASS